MTEKHYNLIITIERPADRIEDREIKTRTYEATFFTHEEGYGNRTYLHIGEDFCFDIRYDTDYHQGQEIAYLAQFASDRWTGKNGSWLLVGLQITGKAEED